MKVIFLDFDGVINNFDKYTGVDEKNVQFLKKIIELTGALVVVTSSTKYAFQTFGVPFKQSIGYLDYIIPLQRLGINIYDFTRAINANRIIEIKDYLEQHPEIDEFLILDDEYFTEEFRKRTVFLENYEGLREEHVKPAVDILNGYGEGYPPNFKYEEDALKRVLKWNAYQKQKESRQQVGVR